jgi:hypothetical protein
MDTLLPLAMGSLFGPAFNHGQQLKVLDNSGVVFTALLRAMPPLDPRLDLEPDEREHATMEVQPPGPALLLNSQVQNTVTKEKWKVLTRSLNGADELTNTYQMVKIVAGTDT